MRECVLVVCLFSLVPLSHAGVCLRPSHRLGLSLSADTVSVNDPDGETQSDVTLYPALIYTHPINRNYPTVRFRYSVSYRQFSLTPAINTVGQE